MARVFDLGKLRVAFGSVEEKFDSIPHGVPVIGFTGALGSGCSFFAKGLSQEHAYVSCSLSLGVHKALKVLRNYLKTDDFADNHLWNPFERSHGWQERNEK